MKKVLCLLLATSMALMVAGCSGEVDTAKDANTTAASSVTAPGVTAPTESSAALVDDLVDQNIGDVYYSVPQTWLKYSSHDTDNEGENIAYHLSDDSSVDDGAFVMVTITYDQGVTEDNAQQRIDAAAEAVENMDWIRGCETATSTIDDRYCAELTFFRVGDSGDDEVRDTRLYILPVYGTGKLLITASAKTEADRDLQADCDTIIDTLEIWD